MTDEQLAEENKWLDELETAITTATTELQVTQMEIEPMVAHIKAALTALELLEKIGNLSPLGDVLGQVLDVEPEIWPFLASLHDAVEAMKTASN